MKAIELSGLEGFKSLRVADVEKPKPAANQILIEVMAAGINFAELELTWGRYLGCFSLPSETEVISQFHVASTKRIG